MASKRRAVASPVPALTPPQRPAFEVSAKRFLSMPLSWVVLPDVVSKEKRWNPPGRACFVKGNVSVKGTLVVGALGATDTFLVIDGSVRCRTLVVPSCSTLLVSHDVLVDEVLWADSRDAVTEVGGQVRAKVCASGSGAWLQVFDVNQLELGAVTSYVMVNGKPHKSPKLDLEKTFVAEVVDDEEWKSLAADERAEEDPADFIELDTTKALRLLLDGKKVLRPQRGQVASR